MPDPKSVFIYTDGSCNPVLKIGAWVAIVFIDDKKMILKGTDVETTHQRMELMAPLKALEYLQQNQLLARPINFVSDSQYVVNIENRKYELKRNNFLTKNGKPIRNDDLVKKLIEFLDGSVIEFTKVVAHQKITESENFNREADKLARKIVREASSAN